MSDEIVIPDKPAFKAAEVCALLKLQPYVLRSWENEFKDLGVSKTPGGPRVYRRGDVERALRIRALMLQEGLTLAGVRRRLEQEAETRTVEDELVAEIAAAAHASAPADPVSTVVPDALRHGVAHVREALRELHEALSRPVAVVPAVSGDAPAGATATSSPSSGDAARQRRARSGSTRPAAARPRHASTEEAPPPVRRELVVEPEPSEPSLFADGETGGGETEGTPHSRPAQKRRTASTSL